MKTFTGLLLLLFSLHAAMAQKKLLRQQKVIINHGISYSLPFNKLSLNPVTDQLTSVNEKGIGIQFFSFNWFVKENFGVELLLHGVTTSNEIHRRKEFVSQVKRKFEGQYYPDRIYIGESQHMSTEKKFTAALAGNYKFERGKFTYIPKFFVGVMVTGQMSARNNFMKERNTNTVIRLDYEGRPHSEGRLLLGPSATMIYRFNSIVGVSFNAFYWWHKADVDFSERITNMATDEVSMNYYRTDKILHGLNLGVSLSLSFGKMAQGLKR